MSNSRDEIRITNPPHKLLRIMIKLAKEGKRSVPKQAELMLEEYIKEHPELFKNELPKTRN